MRRIAAAVGLAVVLAAPAATGDSGFTEIESIELQREGTAVYLSVVAAGPLRWTARAGERELVLYLDQSYPGPEVLDLEPAAGVVAAVQVGTEVGSGTSRTLLTVVTREQADHQVRSWGRVLQIRLRPIAARPPPAPAPQPAEEAGSSPAVGTGAPVAGGNRIGAGDLIAIEVFGLDELDREVRVLRDGTISLPLLGTIPVAGLTVAQAEQKIAALLAGRRLVNDPQVYVVVKEHVSRSVSVQGAVRNPGIYDLGNEKTLLEIIGEAGGLEDRAGTQIFVLRRDADGNEGKITIDAERLMGQGDLSLNLPLEPGDVVTVPHQKRLYVYVNGAVRTPGQVEFLSSEGITVLQAITAAGGTTERASSGRVYVLRQLPDGSQMRIKVNLKKIKRGKEKDLSLEKNDVVVVGEWFF